MGGRPAQQGGGEPRSKLQSYSNFERVTGVGPVSVPWQGTVLPLYYTRNTGYCSSFLRGKSIFCYTLNPTGYPLLIIRRVLRRSLDRGQCLSGFRLCGFGSARKRSRARRGVLGSGRGGGFAWRRRNGSDKGVTRKRHICHDAQRFRHEEDNNAEVNENFHGSALTLLVCLKIVNCKLEISFCALVRKRTSLVLLAPTNPSVRELRHRRPPRPPLPPPPVETGPRAAGGGGGPGGGVFCWGGGPGRGGGSMMEAIRGREFLII